MIKELKSTRSWQSCFKGLRKSAWSGKSANLSKETTTSECDSGSWGLWRWDWAWSEGEMRIGSAVAAEMQLDGVILILWEREKPQEWESGVLRGRLEMGWEVDGRWNLGLEVREDEDDDSIILRGSDRGDLHLSIDFCFYFASFVPHFLLLGNGYRPIG